VTNGVGTGGPAALTDERVDRPIADSGHLLLILTRRDLQSVAELAAASGQHPLDTARTLGRLADQGFIVMADEQGTAVYQLNRKGERLAGTALPEHILLVEHDLLLRELMVEVLEDEGYALITCKTPLHATKLLDQVTFDLVITDGFSHVPGAVLVNTADVVRSAGLTPVVLFSAHTHDLSVAQAAGFRDLIAKPFDIAALVQQVKVLLGH
jgi:CheY-like chemotaxis protein